MEDTLADFWNKFWRDKNGKVVIWQNPNIPLMAWAVFTVVSIVISSKNIADIFSILSFVSLVIWSLLEIVLGVNYFRRLLGLIVLILMALTIVHVF